LFIAEMARLWSVQCVPHCWAGAIGVAATICPIATFYAITSFLLQFPLAVFLVTVATYGFTAIAMLVPAISEFDVATGRTTGPDE